MSDVSRWVSDQLHDLVGLSESTMVEFVLELAKKERSADKLSAKLAALDLPDDARTRAFSERLLGKVQPPASAKAVSAYEAGERERIALAKRNARYALLQDEGAVEKAEKAEKAAKPADEGKTRGKRNLRKRGRSPSNSPSPERERGGKEGKEGKGDADGSDEEAKERKRERDRKERDAIAERIRKRDEAKTRKIGQPEPAKPKTTFEEAKKHMAELRREARHRYLGPRLERIMQDVEAGLEEDKQMFKEEELTEEERQSRRIKERALQYAKEQNRKWDDYDPHGPMYNMPDSYEQADGGVDEAKRMSVLHRRYREVDEDPNKTEQWHWEEHQLQHAKMKVGAQDAAGGAGASAPGVGAGRDEYELVFEDDQIDFIAESVLAGESNKKGGLKGRLPSGEGGEGGAGAGQGADPNDSAIMRTRKSLPVWPFRDELIEAVKEFQVLVVMGETGSGKTTQVPQFLIDAGFCANGKKIGCTQPRRVAAMSVAARVAEEMGVKLGHEVGYSIRFEDCTSSSTILTYMTDGMLLREFLSEPDLAQYSVLIIDEAHERTLHTDILFGLVKDLCRFRDKDDFKVLISSATLDAEKFSNYFDNAPVFNIPGRRYPVDIYYTKAPEADYIEAAVVTVLQIHVTQGSGDVLVFLTGQEEIESMQEMLQFRTRGLGSKIGELIILPIYATLPTDMQAKIFEPTPPGARKVVLATNIAETSITIDNILFVIDPGFSKQTSYNPRTGMESLIVTPISKASARQRAGRAGRVAPGKCFRLFTAWAYQHELEENTIPEIQRTNLGNVVLMLKSLGIDDLIHFDFMDPPPAETLIKALELLYALGALNDLGELTKLGRRMAEFPTDPMMSKAIIQSEKYKCTNAVVSIVAMLSVNNVIFYRPKDKKLHADNARKNFHKPGGDHLTLLNVYTQWAETSFSTQWCFENFVQVRSMKRARDVREQLEGLCERVEVPLDEDDDVDPFHNNAGVRKAITSGFFPHTSKLQKAGTYRTVKYGQTVHVHPQSALFDELPRWVVYHELVYTTKEYMRQIVEIDARWLVEIAPHYYKEKDIHDSSTVKMPRTKQPR